MRRMIAVLMVTLLTSFTSVNLPTTSANNLTNAVTYTTLVTHKTVNKNVADMYLWDNFKINTTDFQMCLPLDASGLLKITDRFGWRKSHPVLHHAAFHNGIDFAGKKGTNILPSADGIVIEVDYSCSYGKYIKIDHGNGITTLYAHLNKQNVSIGEQVTVNTVIGLLGSTGWSTGPHLHFEIKVHDKFVNPANLLSTSVVSDAQFITKLISNRIKNDGNTISDGTYHLTEYSKGNSDLRIAGLSKP